MTKRLTTTEALKILYNHEDLQGGHDEYWEAYRFIEKQLKALEIIKKKKVNVYQLFFLFKLSNGYEVYEKLWNIDIDRHLQKNSDILYSLFLLAKEEFDLLKEVLL